MHVILTQSLIGERPGHPGDRYPVADQEAADDMVKAGLARYAEPPPFVQLDEPEPDPEPEPETTPPLADKPVRKGKAGTGASA